MTNAAQATVQLLLRPELAESGEREAAARYFPVIEQRTRALTGALVVGRYSVVPHYREVYDDVAVLGARLLHTPRQHAYLADLGNWSVDLAELTPPSWRRIEDVPPNEPGPFVLKGKTSSRKDRWRTHMFAADRAALPVVRERLLADTFMEAQGLYVRRFVPLRTILEGIGGMPVTHEYRCFMCRGEVLAVGYYWANYVDEPEVRNVVDTRRVPRDLLAEVARRVGDRAEFYTVDVAETSQGDWTVVELNEGQMSGLSCVDAEEMYAALARTLATPGAA